MISTIFFDLDGTIYSNSTGLWKEISSRIDLFLETELSFTKTEIQTIREKYFKQYGTTLRGLQINHKVDSDTYLAFVHDIDLDEFIVPSQDLINMLKILHQSKWIFTNSDKNHALRVLSQLEIADLFDGIIGVSELEFMNKPQKEAYNKALQISGNPNPENCLMVDDIYSNLLPASDMGMTTVIVSDSQKPELVDFSISKLDELTNEIPLLLEYRP